jgi:hypothetical protein
MPNGELVYLTPPQDVRKPLSPTAQRAQNGLAMFYTSVDALTTLRRVGKGKFGGPEARAFNTFLASIGQPPVGSMSEATNAVLSLYTHNVIPVINYMQGTRQTDALRAIIFKVFPTLMTSDERAESIGNTTLAVLQPIIKDVVQTSIANGEHLDAHLMSLYGDLHLDKVPFTDMLKNRMLEQANLPPEAQGKPMWIPVDEKSVMIGGTTYSYSDIDAFAKKHGTTRWKAMYDMFQLMGATP